ncbi:Golgi transport complex subunit 4 [Batrachochytrium dendrobatidis]|nr:Golgi transport complex subunit 4 [Batrachochytrium dendrobatidis]KAK5671848.1 Golgi transport complex subunit 4 [Batrachochytrium dendrobatidis]
MNDSLVESLSLQKLHGLTDIHQIKEQLAILKLEEANVDADLDSILQGQHQLNATLDKLELLRPQLHSLRTDTDGLLRVIDKTWSIAQGISDKVRQLDLEQSRVKTTLELLHDIQELKICAYGAHMAILENDYEMGASYIHKYLQFNVVPIQEIFTITTLPPESTNTLSNPDSSITNIPSNPDTDTLGLLGPSPVTQLESAQATLTNMVMEAFETAACNDKPDGIVRCFKLFPLIGKVDLGLDLFSAHICRTVSRSCQDGIRAAIEAGKQKMVYVDLLTKLFEAIATMIDRQIDLVETYYGPGRMLPVMVRLQREADIQSSIILGGLKETLQLERKVKEIQQYENQNRRKPQKGTSNLTDTQQMQPPVDPRELDLILGEITTVCQKAYYFDRFLRMRASDQVNTLKANASSDSLSENGKDGLMPTSSLNEQIHIFIGYYISIEDYFIRQSIEKALKIDEHDAASLTSSCVDDVFFILETSIRRGVSTSNTDCLAALINSIDRLLEVEFINVLQRRLSQAFTNSSGGIGLSGTSGSNHGSASADPKQMFIVTLNNIGVSCEYTIKLAKEVEELVNKTFGGVTQRDHEKIKSCLDVLTEHAHKFQNILQTWIENFFNQTVKPRIRPLMQTVYSDTKYILSEDEYNHHDATQTFLKRFANAFTKLVASYKQSLTESNYGLIINLTVESIVKDFERYILASTTASGGSAGGNGVAGTPGVKFNQLGALRFDKDVRGMTAVLADTTQWSMRDKFNRLSQISMVLNVESVEEVYEFWGVRAGPISWRLSSSEVRKILGQRIDFSADAIAKLNL